jgi:hypothetical protein
MAALRFERKLNNWLNTVLGQPVSQRVIVKKLATELGIAQKDALEAITNTLSNPDSLFDIRLIDGHGYLIGTPAQLDRLQITLNAKNNNELALGINDRDELIIRTIAGLIYSANPTKGVSVVRIHKSLEKAGVTIESRRELNAIIRSIVKSSGGRLIFSKTSKRNRAPRLRFNRSRSQESVSIEAMVDTVLENILNTEDNV